MSENSSASPSILNDLLTHLQGAPLQNIAQQLGIDTAQTQNAIGAALPMLLGAFQNQPQNASAADQGTGAGLESHTGQLLELLGPIVMSFMAQRMGAGSADSQAGYSADQNGLGGMVGKMLDQDGDGQVGLGDLLKIGGNLFGGHR